MNILLLGKNGQIGWELQRSLAPLGHMMLCERQDANFENLDALRALLRKKKPDFIVNAAAYTAVDKAESDVMMVERINTEAVTLLAEEAKALDAWLVHYSTDHVFDGKKTAAYSEQDDANPLNIYGKSKFKAELSIQSSGCKHLILRTSWVYSARRANFILTVLRLALAQKKLNIVADQVGAPTSAELVADVTALAIYQIINTQDNASEYSGVYHLSASGETSWHNFTKYIIETAQNLGLSTQTTLDNIFPIATDKYPLPALRPANSTLNTSKISNVFNVKLPHWQEPIKRVLTEILQQGII